MQCTPSFMLERTSSNSNQQDRINTSATLPTTSDHLTTPIRSSSPTNTTPSSTPISTPITSSGSLLTKDQDLFCQYFAFQVITNCYSGTDQFFRVICNNTQAQDGSAPFDKPGSDIRRAAQQAVSKYKKKCERRLQRSRTEVQRRLFSSTFAHYSPFTTFLERNLVAEELLLVASGGVSSSSANSSAPPQLDDSTTTSTSTVTPQRQSNIPTTAGFTTPSRLSTTNKKRSEITPLRKSNANMSSSSSTSRRGGVEEEEDQQPFDRWRAAERTKDDVALFHDDFALAQTYDNEGYGVENNWPGYKCSIVHGVTDPNSKNSRAVHNQLIVMLQCSAEEAELMSGRLTANGDGIDILVPTTLSLAVTDLKLVTENLQRGFDNVQSNERNLNISVMMEALSEKLPTERNSDGVDVPMKKITLLFPPPITCNNSAFNDDPSDWRELKVYCACTSTMLNEDVMLDKLIGILSDCVPDNVAPFGSTSSSGMSDGDDEERNNKISFSAAKAMAAEELKAMILETKNCVHVSFQLVIDDPHIRKQYQSKSVRKMSKMFANMTTKSDSAQHHNMPTTSTTYPATALEPEGHFIMYTNAGDIITEAQEVADTDPPTKDTCRDDRSMYSKQFNEATEALRMKECELNSRLQQADEVLKQAKLDQKEAVEATEAFRMKECELNSRLQQADEVLKQAKLDQKEAVEATEAFRLKECELKSRLQQADQILKQAKLDRKDVDNAMREAAAVKDAATKASSKAALDIKAAEITCQKAVEATEALRMKENDLKMAYEKLALDVKAAKSLHHEATSAMNSMREESKKKAAFYNAKQQDLFSQAKAIDDALWTSKQEREAANSVIKQAAADSKKAACEVQSAQELLHTVAVVKEELGFMTSQDNTIPPQSKRRKRKKWDWININQFLFNPDKADKKKESGGD
ncbi:hypothetical protein ACHAWU_006639 [Discostella pseudostelligera]|uniref:Uncharacterized protein n=1 Tax=Discostella pseudostelligera TaxID=259834 RepID=A0ABD3M5I7_9STRA